MAFETYETSVDSSRPIELYTIVEGSNTWRYTNAANDITIGANTWTAVVIERTELADRREQLDAVVEVEIDGSLPLPQKFINSVPGNSAEVTIQRTQDLDTTPGPREVVTLFAGVVESVGFGKFGRRATLAVRALTSAFSKSVPRQTYSGVCNHVLYSTRCGVVRTSFDHSGTVDAIDGRTIDVDGADGEADGYWEGGYIETADGDRRLITGHVGKELTMPLAFADLSVLDTVTIYAGCQHNTSDCNTKFSNIANFGGFPYVPKKNVFETGV